MAESESILYLTVAEFARPLRVTTSSIYAEINAKRIKAVRVGHRKNWRIAVDEFERYTGYPYRATPPDAPPTNGKE